MPRQVARQPQLLRRLDHRRQRSLLTRRHPRCHALPRTDQVHSLRPGKPCGIHLTEHRRDLRRWRCVQRRLERASGDGFHRSHREVVPGENGSGAPRQNRCYTRVFHISRWHDVVSTRALRDTRSRISRPAEVRGCGRGTLRRPPRFPGARSRRRCRCAHCDVVLRPARRVPPRAPAGGS